MQPPAARARESTEAEPGQGARLRAGTVFAGYEILAHLGKGGMADVYLAREPGLEREVALKLLRRETLTDTAVTRFAQEARVIAQLDHPCVVPLYRFGVADGTPWMALRHLDGGDLGALMRAGAPTYRRVLAALRDVGAALDHAHRNGVIHRDIKPQNVLLDRRGQAFVTDFGVAKLLHSASGLHTLTGGYVGTPAYMAPEQALGEGVGPAADVYAVGVICFEWLCGRVPFHAGTPAQLLLKHVEEPLPAALLERVPKPVAAVLARALHKEPRKRHPDASSLVVDLAGAIGRRAPAWMPAASVRSTTVARLPVTLGAHTGVIAGRVAAALRAGLASALAIGGTSVW